MATGRARATKRSGSICPEPPARPSSTSRERASFATMIDRTMTRHSFGAAISSSAMRLPSVNPLVNAGDHYRCGHHDGGPYFTTVVDDHHAFFDHDAGSRQEP